MKLIVDILFIENSWKDSMGTDCRQYWKVFK